MRMLLIIGESVDKAIMFAETYSREVHNDLERAAAKWGIRDAEIIDAGEVSDDVAATVRNEHILDRLFWG